MIKRSGLLIMLLAFFLALNTIHAQDVVSDLFGRINGLRASLGLSPYTLNSALTAAAQNQANWMATTGEVSHTQYDGSRPVDRAQANGYGSSWVGENIYMGSIAQVDDAWDFWMNSPIHYAGLTSTNYQDIGIAWAHGEYGQAFVLDFGNPGGGASRPATTNNGGGNNTAAEVPQLAILGYDAVGNIRYQLQEGETLGDVLLLFGYTWDDLPTLMALNGFTDADITSLDVGQEILVMPHGGTWTPSAGEMTAEVSAEQTKPAQNTAQPSPTFDVRDLTPNAEATTVNNGGILPTPDSNSSFILPSPTSLEEIAPPDVFVAGAASPTEASQIAAVATTAPTDTFSSAVASPAANSFTQPSNSNPQSAAQSDSSPQSGIPLWLIGAIVIQLGVLVYAGFELIRRMRKA